LVLALFLLLAVFAVFSAHFDYALPFHIDSMEHLFYAEQIAAEKSVSALVGDDWELGYHLLLSLLLTITGLSALQLGLVFPVFSGFLMALLTFVLVKSLAKSNLAALLSAVLSLAMSSTVGVLGPMFLVPMALGIALLPASLWFFAKGIDSKKHALLLAVLLVQQTLIHPAYSLMLLVVFAVFLVVNFRILLRNQVKVVIAIILLFVLLPFFAQRFLEIKSLSYSPQNFQEIFDAIGTKLSWTSIQEWKSQLFFVEFLKEPLFIASLFGLGLVCSAALMRISKKFRETFGFLFKNPQIVLLCFFFIALLPFYMQFNLTGSVFLLPYERFFMAMYYALLVLAGIGIFSIIVLFSRAMGFVGSKTTAAATKALVFFVLVFLVFEIATQPFEFQKTFYKTFERENVPVVYWLEQNASKQDIVVALPWHSSAIAALTPARAAIKPTVKMKLDPQERLAEAIANQKANAFFSENCKQRKTIVEELKANAVATTVELDCDFLNRVFDKQGFFIFRVSD